MKGINEIVDKKETIEKLNKMYFVCNARFESELGCKGCKMNITGDNTCFLLLINDLIRMFTKED